jgi:nucleoside-diphosphate-sugar epimerase
MRVLFIGGTGLISSACVTAAEIAGHELWLLNRGHSSLPSEIPSERVLRTDATDPQQVRDVLRGRQFDVVVQWVGFTPEHVSQDVETFADAGQYVYISSASAYEKPPSHWLITESTPLVNRFWEYSRQKIACEQVLRDAHAQSGFPVTIVRPSHTYGDSQIPAIINSSREPFTIVERIRRGAKIIIPGDGTSLWTLTHNSDFAKGLIGLFGQSAAIGEDFHITSDEALDWNRIYSLLGARRPSRPERRDRRRRPGAHRQPVRRQDLQHRVRQLEAAPGRARLPGDAPVQPGDPADGRMVRRRSRSTGDRSRGGRLLGQDRRRLHAGARTGGRVDGCQSPLLLRLRRSSRERDAGLTSPASKNCWTFSIRAAVSAIG